MKIKYIPIDENYFFTSDIGCSAALVSLGFEIISLDKEDPQRVRFIFHLTPELRSAIDSYWSNQLTASARTLFENLKMLKNRIYSQ